MWHPHAMAQDRSVKSPFALRMAGLLRMRMLELGMNQKQLAALSGVDETKVSRTLSALRDVTGEELHHLCAALGLDPAEALRLAAGKEPRGVVSGGMTPPVPPAPPASTEASPRRQAAPRS